MTDGNGPRIVAGIAPTDPPRPRRRSLICSRAFALPLDHEPTRIERRRAIRVWLLVGTVVVLSMADLYMTLAHLRSAGMGEGNPLARVVIDYQSPMLLSLWKVACVALAALILILARFKRSGELACWTCCIVMTALTIQWFRYATEAPGLTTQISDAAAMERTGDWVTIGQTN